MCQDKKATLSMTSASFMAERLSPFVPVFPVFTWQTFAGHSDHHCGTFSAFQMLTCEPMFCVNTHRATHTGRWRKAIFKELAES